MVSLSQSSVFHLQKWGISSQPDLLRELQLSFLHSFLAPPWVSVAAENPSKTSEETASISYLPD